ncbi:MAG: pyruvate:ferredoxin (flavodoxin) oxidoreductase, partial [Duncaniella sp.]|nr:pyruvate:ferredoxin (flavodoxin) oxidoreductase [Duncaniella sp.]
TNSLEAWLDAKDDPERSAETGKMLAGILAPLQDADPRFKELYEAADLFPSNTVWAIGGDGWAYDIGFAGLDHVLASGEPVKILVMDTECYSNTGGQTSKATPRSAVAKYSPDGKRTAKKDLGRMMMTYGNVYVASIALGANYQQAIDALVEAERYPGPAIVIAYCPCIAHGIKAGQGHSIVEERRAVECGYWPLYRFDPQRYARGETALTVDAPAPDGTLQSYIDGENRYADLKMTDPREAGILRPELEQDCNQIYSALSYQKQYGAK